MDGFLLVDESETVNFLKRVIVPLENDEVLLLSLAARRKYCPGIEKSGAFLHSEIVRDSNIDNILMKIRRMAFVKDCYRSRKTGNYIKPECMVMYIDLEPKSTIQAFDKLTEKNNKLKTELLTKIIKNNQNSIDAQYFERFKKMFSWSEQRSALAKSRARKLYCDIDIDVKDENLLVNIIDIIKEYGISSNKMTVIETRGGYHIIIPNEGELIGRLYHEYGGDKKNKVEIHNKQVQVPIPGTLQGGFLVRLIVV